MPWRGSGRLYGHLFYSALFISERYIAAGQQQRMHFIGRCGLDMLLSLLDMRDLLLPLLLLLLDLELLVHLSMPLSLLPPPLFLALPSLLVLIPYLDLYLDLYLYELPLPL